MFRWPLLILAASVIVGCTSSDEAPSPTSERPPEIDAGERVTFDPNADVSPHDRVVSGYQRFWSARKTETAVTVTASMSVGYEGGHVLDLVFSRDGSELVSSTIQRFNDVGSDFPVVALEGTVTIARWDDTVVAGIYTDPTLALPFWVEVDSDRPRHSGEVLDIAVGETVQAVAHGMWVITVDDVLFPCDGCNAYMIQLALGSEGWVEPDLVELDLTAGPATLPGSFSPDGMCVAWNDEAQVAEFRFCDGRILVDKKVAIEPPPELVGVWDVIAVNDTATPDAGGGGRVVFTDGQGLYADTTCSMFTTFHRTLHEDLYDEPTWFGHFPLGCVAAEDTTMLTVLRNPTSYLVLDDEVVLRAGSESIRLAPSDAETADPALGSALLLDHPLIPNPISGTDATPLLNRVGAVCPALWALRWPHPGGPSADLLAAVEGPSAPTVFFERITAVDSPELALEALDRGYALTDWCDSAPTGTEPRPGLEFVPLVIETGGDSVASFRLIERFERECAAGADCPAPDSRTADVAISTVGSHVVLTIAFTDYETGVAAEFAELSAAAVAEARTLG